MDTPTTRYARSGDLFLGYQDFGEAQPAIVVVPGRTSNVVLAWEDPARATFFEHLAGFARVLMFDKRGIGVSDRAVALPTLEEQADDVRSVMDAAALERAIVFGTRDGAALAALFAASSPDRVAGLMLWQPQMRGAWAVDYPWGMREREFEWQGEKFASAEHVDSSIRTQTPTRKDDPVFRRWYRRFLQLSSSPTTAAAQARMQFDSDVREALASVRVPTLVMHGGVDFVEESRDAADRIPGAQFVEFPEVMATAPYLVDSPRALALMQEFAEASWAAAAAGVQSDRILATVLFTDLVGSSEHALALGPRWQDVLREHNAAIRRELVRYRGREIDTAGDGFFASGFDGPARAIRCGCAIRDALRALGLEVRIGLHTGECDVVDGKLAGIAVAIGARIAGEADHGDVLVSGTVRDLVAGSGIAFESRGIRPLKGIGGWPVYAVVDP